MGRVTSDPVSQLGQLAAEYNCAVNVELSQSGQVNCSTNPVTSIRLSTRCSYRDETGMTIVSPVGSYLYFSRLLGRWYWRRQIVSFSPGIGPSDDSATAAKCPLHAGQKQSTDRV